MKKLFYLFLLLFVFVIISSCELSVLDGCSNPLPDFVDIEIGVVYENEYLDAKSIVLYSFDITGDGVYTIKLSGTANFGMYLFIDQGICGDYYSKSDLKGIGKSSDTTTVITEYLYAGSYVLEVDEVDGTGGNYNLLIH